MLVAEFKAWFEGFTENMSGIPNKKQWDRIKKRVEEIDDEPITERIFTDRYYRPYKDWWEWDRPRSYWTSTAGSTAYSLQSAGKAEWKALS